MNRFLRILLAWCLAAALPLQGFAAHAMQTCASAQGRAAHAVEAVLAEASLAAHGAHLASGSHVAPVASASGSPASHASHAPAHHGHAFAPADAGAAQADTPTHPSQDHASGHAHGGKCSACASCCHAAAIAADVLTVWVVPQFPVAVATVPLQHAPVFLRGLDRPPRA